MNDLFTPAVIVPEGVEWEEKYCKWRACIEINGKEIVLGRFNYLESAVTVLVNK